MHRTPSRRILALYTHSRFIFFAALEGPNQLLDWGGMSRRRGVNARSTSLRTRLASVIQLLQPSRIVLQRTCRGESGHLAKVVVRTAESEGIPVRLVTTKEVRRALPRDNKHQATVAIAARFPQLRHHLPPDRSRKPWKTENYRFGVFDAIAAGLVYHARFDLKTK